MKASGDRLLFTGRGLKFQIVKESTLDPAEGKEQSIAIPMKLPGFTPLRSSILLPAPAKTSTTGLLPLMVVL